MNLLSQTAKIYRQNVGYLSRVSSPATINLLFTRSLSTGEWKKYLNILDVTKNSTPKDIKDSFLKLSKVYHPDNKATGSHMKFVELKEAYDALKDGHPTITSTRPTSANNYNNYYDTDASYTAHRAYRDRYRDYQTSYEHRSYGFGGPYRNSSTPWEDMARDREFRRQRAYSNSFGNRAKPLVSITIILSAMAYIVIYSCVLLIWDYNDTMKKRVFNFTATNNSEYARYREYIERKAAARKLKLERDGKESLGGDDDSEVQATQLPNLSASSPPPIDLTTISST